MISRVERNQKMKKYYEENKEKINKRQREYRNKHPDKQRNWNWKRRYGISTQEYNNILLIQDGKCAICGKIADGERYKRLSIDHCHNSGLVRGLLCHRCNSGIGLFQENATMLINAAAYILKHTS